MSNSHLKPLTTLPSLATQEAKAQRKRVLEEVRERRHHQEQERRKRQQRAYQTSEEYREYQDQLREEAMLS